MGEIRDRQSMQQGPAPSGPPRRRHAARHAASMARQRKTVRLVVPELGAVTLPSPGRFAFYAGLGLAAACGLVEWPVAVAVGVGHALVDNSDSESLRAFGEALEAA